MTFPYIIEALYSSVAETIADILLDEVLVIEQIVGHQWLLVCDVLLFDGRHSYRFDQRRMCHQIALVVHYETCQLILTTHRPDVRLQKLVEIA